MSTTVLQFTCKVNGVLTDPSSVVLSDAGANFGVRRLDTLAVVVAAGTAMQPVSTGCYEYAITDPAPGLTYGYVVTAVIGGVTYRESATARGGSAGMSDLTNLDPQIVPQVKGATLAMIHHAVRRVFRDFCRDTEIWVHTQESLTVAEEAYCAFLPPANTKVGNIESVTVAEMPVSVRVPKPEDLGVTFRYAPTEDGDVIELRYVVIPSLVCTQAPDWLLSRYGDGIASGAIAYLAGMAGKPWFSADTYRLEHDRYLDAVSDARREKLQARGPGARLPIPVFV